MREDHFLLLVLAERNDVTTRVIFFKKRFTLKNTVLISQGSPEFLLHISQKKQSNQSKIYIFFKITKKITKKHTSTSEKLRHNASHMSLDNRVNKARITSKRCFILFEILQTCSPSSSAYPMSFQVGGMNILLSVINWKHFF